ncbi:MAG: hypothetical protein LBU84_09690 [Prevotella sp.]|jgi:hypothetical protein|nr:hypothetical protein [Prevotella sp.]
MKNINAIIIQKIIDSIPPNMKLAEFLMDKLGLCKESAYRRIRGDVAFTIEQIMHLSLELGFSIDELVAQKNNDYILYRQKSLKAYEPNETFVAMFETFYESISRQCQAKDSYTIIALNRLPDIFTVSFENLFRFYYYKWVHQINDTSVNQSFSEIVLPPEVATLRNKILPYAGRHKNITFILDPNTFYNTLSDIQYYCSRGLIDDKELALLKNELRSIQDGIEILIRKGTWQEGHSISYSYSYYLSSVPIENNSCYVWYDNHAESHYWFNSVISFYNKTKQATDLHKIWLESLKKYAELMTKSNELVQASYLKKHAELIETMF